MRLGRPCRQSHSFPLATIGTSMEEIELIKLQDEALFYLRDNITKDEAYYILTTDEDMIEILIADKKDGGQTYQDS